MSWAAGWFKELMMICGMSLDVFAVMTCQGCVVAKIDKKRLFLLCLLSSLWQALALAAGNYLFVFLNDRSGGYETVLGRYFAAAILIVLGMRLLAKAWKNEPVVERREEFCKIRGCYRQLLTSGIFMLPAGTALGFLGFSLSTSLPMVVCVTMLGAAFGMYNGYRLGFGQKQKALAIGACLLLLSGLDAALRCFVDFS